MESFTDEAARLGGSTGRISRSLMALGENRLKLLILEFEEERILFVRSLVLSLGVFAFGLLGMGALTAAVVIGPWTQSPGLVLGVFGGPWFSVEICRERPNSQTSNPIKPLAPCAGATSPGGARSSLRHA